MAERFGAYEILHELKSGGMGSVLLGRRRGPGAFEQLVALKTIRAEYAGADAVRAMFLDEAAILARINHPGIAAVHDFGEEAGALYMAMEYVAGISFRGLIEHGMPPVIAARAIAEACRGLHAAHEVRDPAGGVMGVVHRDISPDNLMLGFDGHVKVIDFGIALVKNRQAPVTEFGMLKGKPPYMSPEQVKNEAMDRRSDVFSLAVVLHELLADRPLFDGDSIYAVARAVEHMEIRPPSQVLHRALPAGLDAAVMRALDRDVARRTPTAAALAEELEAAISATGDETLEAWAERELAQPRDAHRAWLASVVAGREATHGIARAVGRASGALTQLPAAPPPVPAEEPRSQRRRIVPILLALVVLAAVIAGVVMTRTKEPPAGLAQAPIDAAIDAEPPLLPQPIDAAIGEDAPPVPIDAAVIAPPRRRPPATARTVPPPAAPAPATPSAMGMISIRSNGEGFLNIFVDGKPFQVTPQIQKPIAAGSHTIELLDPKTGAVVYTTTVDVEPGEHVRVRQP